MSRELPQLILATLSAGPVGVGDALGEIDSSAPMVAATRSGEEREVFAYPRADAQKQATVSLRQLGVQGPVYEWDWVRQRGTRVPAGGSFPMVFQDGWAYAVVMPIGKDGMSVLGDTESIVPLARRRFPVVTNSTSAHVTITYAPGEDAVRLSGYAAGPPTLRAAHGSLDSMQYSAATHLFRVTVHPPRAEAGAHTAELVIRNPEARRLP